MIDKYTQIFKALSDITRQEILEMLKIHEMCVNDICEKFERMSQPTISHHLQVLKHCDLVDTRKEGKLIYYFFKRDALLDTINEFFAKFEIGE